MGVKRSLYMMHVPAISDHNLWIRSGKSIVDEDPAVKIMAQSGRQSTGVLERFLEGQLS